MATVLEERERQNAAQLLFLSCLHSERIGRQFSLVTMSCLSLRTAAPPPCLPLYIKDSLKEGLMGF
jgi:hypothetical protein